ncbi:hypothetical protein QN277_026483 [Acacia crassicarpa]|uniref:Retrotransposon Copia-like N-terminal domain-containing protein n=1 Tax=Acacia crassicarpa TaxID=499986 RepID=A0AAE1J9F0_9FABA|nr:hypothetical protein QN277_026483 [Acacia crassicarpa]
MVSEPEAAAMADFSSTATGAAAGAPTDPVLNVSSPYYLHPSENPGLVLVTSVLTGLNYHTWSHAMKVALQSKNNLGFVDGTILMPAISDSNYSTWLRCNTMVCTWIARSLSPTIAQSILWLDKAYDIWNNLKAGFAVSDVFRVAELQDEIYASRQGDLLISEYYTKLKIFWDEYMILRPITRCSCNFICPCTTYLDNDYTLRFLKGLNDRFASVKSQIMQLEPLPSVHKVFSLLLQQEREMHSPSSAAPQAKDHVINSVIEHTSSSTGSLASSDPKSTPIPQFTPDQYQKLLALVQQNSNSSTNPVPSVNNLQSVSSSHQDPGSFSLEDDWYS